MTMVLKKACGKWEIFTAPGGAVIRLFMHPLSASEKINITNMIVRGESGDALSLVLRKAIENWEGVEDEEGAPVTYEPNRADTLFGQSSELADHFFDWVMAHYDILRQEKEQAGRTPDPTVNSSAASPSEPSTSESSTPLPESPSRSSGTPPKGCSKPSTG